MLLLPPCEIPGGSSLALRQDAPTLLVALGEGRKPLVFTFHDPKQTVGLLAAPHQPSVEAHPFRTPQGRSLHIVGTFDDGNPRLFEHAIPATVLERREQDSVRLQIDDAFHIGIHRLAAVGNGVFGLCQRRRRCTSGMSIYFASATPAIRWPSPSHSSRLAWAVVKTTIRSKGT